MKQLTILLSALFALLLVPPAVAGTAAQTKPSKSKPAAVRTQAGARKAPAAGLKPMTEAQQAEHVINRLGYGPRPGETARIAEMGVTAWIEQQLAPEKIDDGALEARIEPLKTLKMSNEELSTNFPQGGEVRRVFEAVRSGKPVPPRAKELYDRLAKEFPKLPEMMAAGGGDQQKMYEQMTPEQRRYMQMHSPQRITLELQQAKLLRAVYSERQLQEQMVDFWMNHFNVHMGKGADRWLVTGYERDAIRPHVLGNFRDLVMATAEHPAMLFYLDNFQSSAPSMDGGMGGPGRARGLNENYARVLMELHTLGVDGGYTQKDVVEVARAFTGWTIRRPRDNAESIFNARMHDDGEKTVLGVSLPGGGGRQDGVKVIDMLVRHPSTARFIATKLARRFVADAPPETLVARVAAAFTASSGDIRQTLRALFASPEFFSAGAYRAKVKKPIELVASALRASGAEVGFSPPLLQTVARLGEPLYLCEPPTGYPDVAAAWINTGLMLNRVNFAGALAAGQVPNVKINPEAVRLPELGEKTSAALKQETEPARIAGLILGSPEFQRR